MKNSRMITSRYSRLQCAVVVVSVVYAIAFLVMLVVRPGSRQFYQAFFNTYQILPPLFAGICGLIYVRRGHHISRTHRLGWLAIACGSLSFALGQSTWTYYESIRGIEVPFPGWADAGYLGTYPFLITGVVLLFGSMPIAGRARLLLDSAIAASSVGVLSWYYLVRLLWHKSDVALLGKLISAAYPLGDVAALFSALVLISGASANKERRRSLIFLASGMVGLAFADSAFTYYSLHNAYQTGSWSDWGWSFGWMLIGYASLLRLWRPAEIIAREHRLEAQPPSVSTPSPFRLMLPYLAVAVAFVLVALHDHARHGGVTNSVFIAGSGLISLVILRQVLTLWENQQLTVKLRASNEELEEMAARLRVFNENLEQMVARRTEQLIALNHLTKAVNSTRQVDQVLADAARHTRHALQADAVALWVAGEDADGAPERPLLHLYEGLQNEPKVLEYLGEQLLHPHVELLRLPLLAAAAPHGESWFLRAPLRWQDRPVGMIGVIRWQGAFERTEPELLESIGIEVGTALEMARQYDAALEAADRDPVTGLYNHRAVRQRLKAELQRAREHDQSLALLMMDLNNFKLFNDTYGHPAGDQVLKRVARVLMAECRKQDVVARYGGDEFLVVLPGSDAQEAMAVAQRLRYRMMQEGFQRSDEELTIPVSLSLGIAACPEDSAHPNDLLTIADANLYLAKHSDDGIQGTTERQRANRELRSESSFGVLDAMVTAVDNKDRYTRRHSEDVTEYALWIAEELGLSDETMRVIRVGGLLHDVGKIGVPDEILRKPGGLTPEEWEVMRRHPQLGALIVAGVPGMEGILDIVRYHHERWDGQGYPDGRSGEEIPLLGRILAVADAFSAMTTDRPYRKGMNWNAALDEVRRNAGTQFDPTLAYAFLRAAKTQRPTRDLPAAPPEEQVELVA
jgi:diguanylate cyclase (GGDEF)-like protein/putative nucleotidyltransferase with HDIG domain